jgi:hypothetical protein
MRGMPGMPGMLECWNARMLECLQGLESGMASYLVGKNKKGTKKHFNFGTLPAC